MILKGLNPALKNDLYHFYKGMKNEILFKLKNPNYFKDNPFVPYGSSFYCNKLRFRVFDWLIADIHRFLLIKSETGYKLKWTSYDDFINEVIKTDSNMRKIEKLSKCYDITEHCIQNYRTFRIDDIEIHCNIRYKSALKKVFYRFGANQKCIVVKDNIKGMQLVIITKGENVDETKAIHSGSNS